MIYAVIDTNVLVSAIKSHKLESSSSVVINLIAKDFIVPLLSAAILREYEEVLSFPVLDLDKTKVEAILNKIRTDGLYLATTSGKEAFPDESDREFYEISQSFEGAYVITKNLKHFPSASRVVSPSEMLRILQEGIDL